MNQPTVWDGVDKLYAEMLKGSSVTLTIQSVEKCKVEAEPGKTKDGFRVTFSNAKRPWEFSAIVVRRQFTRAYGSDLLADYAGKQIVIYPENCKTKHSDFAIRVNVAATQDANR